MTSRIARAVGAALLALPPLVAGAGCDWLRPGGPPDEATIFVSSQDVAEATLVVSSEFDWNPGGGAGCDDPDVQCPDAFHLRSADTTLAELPYTHSFKFTSSELLFAMAFPDASVGAWMGMRVEIGGREHFNGFLYIGPEDDDGNREKLRYAYSYARLQ